MQSPRVLPRAPRLSLVHVALLAWASACGSATNDAATSSATDAPTESPGANGATNGAGNAADGGLTDAADAGLGTRHPLYPDFDLATLPGPKGGSTGTYQPPALPTTTRTITVTTTGNQARADLAAACQIAGTAVTVPNGAGRIGGLELGNVVDCDVTLGDQVIVDHVRLGHLGVTLAPVHRVRFRGGKLGGITVGPDSTDVVFDGVIVDNALVSPTASPPRVATGIVLEGGEGSRVDRFAVVHAIVRMVPSPSGAGSETDGNAFSATLARNVFFANDNVVSAGNRDAWGFRIGGGQNYLFVDNTVRAATDELVRMSGAPVDYVFIKAGTWIRQHSDKPGTFAQVEHFGTDHVYIHDPILHFLASQTPIFGSNSALQTGSWEARRMTWHTRSAGLMSDDLLTIFQSRCPTAATCDYGVGTHAYVYDFNMTEPANPWRALPTIADANPDHLPVQ